MTADIEGAASAADDVARRRQPRVRGSVSEKRPLRSIGVFAAVLGLVAAIGLPAFAPSAPVANATTTLQQIAKDDAQSLIVVSEIAPAENERGIFLATTEEEIAKKKAEEAARKRARVAASSVNIALTAPGSGQVRYPVTSYSYGPRNLFRAPSRPNHNGFDMVAPGGTPIYAATSGVVTISQESYYGFGVAIVIEGNVNGSSVRTTYAHMTHGTRRVSVGQTVQAGQLIGQVGTTGRSNANHLHFEVRINGGLVDPRAWLIANAG